jgi:iron complex transport system substrate-binding protein
MYMYKRSLLILLNLILFAFFSGCSAPEKKTTSRGRVLKDDLGREVQIPDSAVRIFPAASSVTEYLYLLVDEDRIVARTQNDSFPAQVLSKPVINNYPVDFEKILELKPDLVIAKEGILPPDDAKRIESMGIPVYYLVFENIEDIIRAGNVLGNLLGVEKRAKIVTDSISEELKRLKKGVPVKDSVSVLITISHEPIYVFGKDSYATSILSAAGAKNAVDEVFSTPFPPLRREYVLKIDPEVLMVGEAGNFFEKYPELKNIRAYRNNRICHLDGELISRPGPRVGITVKKIQELLYGKK